MILTTEALLDRDEEEAIVDDVETREVREEEEEVMDDRDEEELLSVEEEEEEEDRDRVEIRIEALLLVMEEEDDDDRVSAEFLPPTPAVLPTTTALLPLTIFPLLFTFCSREEDDPLESNPSNFIGFSKNSKKVLVPFKTVSISPRRFSSTLTSSLIEPYWRHAATIINSL